jgi:hypothetical protein
MRSSLVTAGCTVCPPRSSGCDHSASASVDTLLGSPYSSSISRAGVSSYSRGVIRTAGVAHIGAWSRGCLFCHMGTQKGPALGQGAFDSPSLSDPHGREVFGACGWLSPSLRLLILLPVIPQAWCRKGGLPLWQGCTQSGGMLSCSATTLLSQLKKMFLHRVRGKYPGQLEIGASPPASSPRKATWGSGGTVTETLLEPSVRVYSVELRPLPRCPSEQAANPTTPSTCKPWLAVALPWGHCPCLHHPSPSLTEVKDD